MRAGVKFLVGIEEMTSNEYLVLIGALFTIFILISQSHSVFGFGDPKHCQGYDACYAIGYRDGYNDAQNGVSHAYVCVGHSENWCTGYNDGFRAGNGGSNIFYGQSSDQSTTLNVHGDNNKISINEQSNQLGDDGRKSSDGVLPNCMILCLNSDIRIK